MLSDELFMPADTVHSDIADVDACQHLCLDDPACVAVGYITSHELAVGFPPTINTTTSCRLFHGAMDLGALAPEEEEGARKKEEEKEQVTSHRRSLLGSGDAADVQELGPDDSGQPIVLHEAQVVATNRENDCVQGSVATCDQPPDLAYTMVRFNRTCRNSNPSQIVYATSVHECAVAIAATGATAFFAYSPTGAPAHCTERASHWLVVTGAACLPCLPPTGSSSYWADVHAADNSVFNLLTNWEVLLLPIREPPDVAALDSERLERALGSTTHRVFDGSLCQDHLGWTSIAESDDCLAAAYAHSFTGSDIGCVAVVVDAVVIRYS